MLAVRSKRFTLWLVILSLITLVVSVGIGLTRTDSGQAEIAFNKDNLIRLHVVANSDSSTDQQLKLGVRDAILEASGALLDDTHDFETAWQILQSNLDVLKKAAAQRILAAGENYPVQVELGKYPFPPKAYGNFVLAGGVYPTLKVTIGEGSGHNWWCVLFPPLCFLNMSGPLATERLQKEESPNGKTEVAVDLKNPWGFQTRQIPVVTPGLRGK
ncbi:MAG: stage II sporulation protein R [Firmicutes bacterium]|nr:stage II sporulation protein R [Bacillota bacterium]